MARSRNGAALNRGWLLRQLPPLLCAFLLFLYTLFFLYRVIIALFYPYSLEYSEGTVFYETGQLFRSGFNPASLYPDNEAPPYLAAVYSPLFYYLNGVAMSLWGSTSFFGGRLISVLSTFYIGISLFRIAGRTELAPGRLGNFLISLAVATTPFATAAVYSGAVIAKPDMLAIALSLAAAQMVWNSSGRQRRNSNQWSPYLLAGLLCALALFTKQSALAAPMAIVIWLGLSRKWPEVLAFGGSYLGVVLAAGSYFQLASGGNFFRHVISYNAQPFSFEFLGVNLNYFFLSHLVLLVLAGFWVVRPLVGRYEPVDLWRIYLLTALLVTLSAGKVGSNFNYYIESICLVALLAWCQVGRLLALRPVWRPGPLRIPTAVLTMALLAFQFIQLHHIPVLADGAFTPGLSDFEQAGRVAAKIREIAGLGPLLAEDSGWQAAVGLPLELDDPFLFGQLATSGIWDNRNFLEKINNGYFRYFLYEISNSGQNEVALEQAVLNGTAEPFPLRFDQQVLKIIQNRTRYVPEVRYGRWLFLRQQS